MALGLTSVVAVIVFQQQHDGEVLAPVLALASGFVGIAFAVATGVINGDE